MKSKIFCIFLILVFFLLPLICFSEVETANGKHCQKITGLDETETINWEIDRKVLRLHAIEKGLETILPGETIPLELVGDIQKKYLKNFNVISHTVGGRTICEEVQFTIDTKILHTVINQNKSYRDNEDYLGCIYLGYADGLYDFLINYIKKLNKPMNLGITVDFKKVNKGTVSTEIDEFVDLIAEKFAKCLYHEFKDKIKIITKQGKRGKIENVNNTLYVLCDESKCSIKLLKYGSEKALYSYTIYADKKEEP